MVDNEYLIAKPYKIHREYEEYTVIRKHQKYREVSYVEDKSIPRVLDIDDFLSLKFGAVFPGSFIIKTDIGRELGPLFFYFIYRRHDQKWIFDPWQNQMAEAGKNYEFVREY